MEERTELELAHTRQPIHYTVDSYSDGIAFGQHRLEQGQDPREYYALSTQLNGGVVHLRSRYALHQENPFWELERYLMRLSRQGALGSATIYFGMGSDPFHPFEGKFDASMKFLQLFERYTPGMLVVQTRSPLVVLAMPIFKRLGKHAAVTIALETTDQEVAQRYTPELPKIEDRLRAALALRRLGVEVSIQMKPLLPYGDWRADAPECARILNEYADFIFVSALHQGASSSDRELRKCSIANRLAHDRKFHWLRPDSTKPLITALTQLCPEKLKLPDRHHLFSRQLKIFAA